MLGTDFEPASRRYTFNYNTFHPSTYDEADPGTFAGFPDLAHAHLNTYEAVENHIDKDNPIVRDKMMAYAM